MGVEFVSDKLKSVLIGIDKKKEKQSKRKKSLKHKGREKELGEQRIAINIAQREVFSHFTESQSTCLRIGEPEVQRIQQLPPPQKEETPTTPTTLSWKAFAKRLTGCT